MNAVTSLTQLRNPEPAESKMPVVRAGFSDLQGFELAQRAAKALAASTLVPKDFQGNLPNCIVALEMAQRIGASPLMVMQNMYVVHGRPSWSSKFLIASFNQCGRFSAIRYEWSGTPKSDDWGCRAWAVERETNQRIQSPLITIGLAKKDGWYERNGSKWKTIPELMLMYRSAGWLVNTHAPEISMGLNSSEELGDVYDSKEINPGVFETTMEELRSGEAEVNSVFDMDGYEKKWAACVSAEDLRFELDVLRTSADNGFKDAMAAAVTRRLEELTQP